MNVARDLIADLAIIGATVQPAGDRLILRAGSTAIPARLVHRVREAKAEIIALLTESNRFALSEYKSGAATNYGPVRTFCRARESSGIGLIGPIGVEERKGITMRSVPECYLAGEVCAAMERWGRHIEELAGAEAAGNVAALHGVRL
jgi:hypothetical protein